MKDRYKLLYKKAIMLVIAVIVMSGILIVSDE